jgi:hypothetical protein
MSMVRASLEAHRCNLEAAQTFEDYKAAQLKYVDYLIERERANEMHTAAVQKLAGAEAEYLWQVEVKADVPKTD